MLLRGLTRFHTQYLRIFYRFEYMGRGVAIDPSCDIRYGAAPFIYLGDEVKINKDVWLNIPFEAKAPVRGHPIIRIGHRTAVGRRCFFSGINEIRIGEDVLFGPGVFMTDHSHRFDDASVPIIQQGVTMAGRILIEEGCWFGQNCAVVTHKGKELIIGKNSVIGVNAVVTKSCPPNSVLVGVPAKNIRGK